MNLRQDQFNVLVLIEKYQGKNYSINQYAKILHMETSDVEKNVQELLDLELIEKNSDYIVTLKGYRWLEPYRVKKAIFMAAGFGSRMVPVTLNTPKPLIKVNGKRIIETLLDAVIDAGITDITIVRGYLGEQFDLLLKKYPMIKFIENPTYNEANNIGSALMIKDLMDRAYVLESDLVLYNPEIIRKYEYQSNYLGKKVDYTDDWCFDVVDGHIKDVMVGGNDCYHMYGISYWDSVSAKNMSTDVATVYNMEPDGKQKYWDEVSLRFCKENYDILVRPVFEGDIIEIDTYQELKAIDSIYDC